MQLFNDLKAYYSEVGTWFAINNFVVFNIIQVLLVWMASVLDKGFYMVEDKGSFLKGKYYHD